MVAQHCVSSVSGCPNSRFVALLRVGKKVPTPVFLQVHLLSSCQRQQYAELVFDDGDPFLQHNKQQGATLFALSMLPPNDEPYDSFDSGASQRIDSSSTPIKLKVVEESLVLRAQCRRCCYSQQPQDEHVDRYLPFHSTVMVSWWTTV
jgi:hypothetical protein